MWVRQLDWLDPMEAARRLADLAGLSFLDSAMRHDVLGRYSYVAADPFGIFTVEDGEARWNGRPEPIEPALAALAERLAQHRTDRIAGLPPFQGGAIGSIAYEFGWALEARDPPARRRGPDVSLAFYDVVLAFDHHERRCWLIASGHPAPSEQGRRERAEARLLAFAARLGQASPGPADATPALAWRPTLSRDAFCAGVERVKAYIRAGDIYQANIAQRFVATLPVGCAPLALYGVLRAANPAPFSAFLAQGNRTLLSTSPELFLRTDGRSVETRPIKGTARRHHGAGADRAAAEALLASRKDRAENVMIVDLLRNDLSRVCRPASVEVPALCALESYAGLHHLVTVVTGELRPECDALDLLAASFPGGSITGAPKLRAMEIIAEIEGQSRGAYCGAIGSFGFDGSMDLNIAIRTLVVEAGMAELRVGGGITALSEPDAEYEETLTKARRIFDAFAPARVAEDAIA